MSAASTVRRAGAVLVAVVLGLSGCASPGDRLEASDPVIVQQVDAALHAPLWSYRHDVLLGLTDDGRVAEVGGLGSADTTHTDFSAPLSDVGRSLEITPLDESVVYVPQPASGHVTGLRIGDLVPESTLDAGPAPSYLASNSGSRTLLSLSADGSTVTPVDLHRTRVLPATRVDARPDAQVEGAARGRRLDFHVADTGGVAHFVGVDPPAERSGNLDLSVAALVGDGAKVSRLYVAQRDSGRLVAVDSDTDEKGMRVVASADLGEPVRFVATDDTRVYAVTDHRVVVLAAHSFDGFSGGVIPVIREFDYRAALPESAKTAPVSGLAASTDRVYLTLASPWVVGVAKPKV